MELQAKVIGKEKKKLYEYKIIEISGELLKGWEIATYWNGFTGAPDVSLYPETGELQIKVRKLIE